jgi:hypothetical protein
MMMRPDVTTNRMTSALTIKKAGQQALGVPWARATPSTQFVAKTASLNWPEIHAASLPKIFKSSCVDLQTLIPQTCQLGIDTSWCD